MKEEEIKYQIDHKMKLARNYEAEGKLLHAVQIYNSVIEAKPEFADAYYNLAELYETLGNIEPALKLLFELLSLDEENKEVRLFIGQYLLRNSRWDEANEVLSFIPPEEEPMVSFFLGYSYYMIGDYELAKINYLNFVSNEKESELIYEANFHLAKIEAALKNYESSLKYLKNAEALYSNYWELSLLYAICYYNLDMHAHASGSVEKSIKLNPKEASNYRWAGKIYLKLGDYLKAEKQFLKFIDAAEEASSENYAELAEACLKNKKAKDALIYFDIALKLDPQNKSALEGKKNAVNIVDNNAASDG